MPDSSHGPADDSAAAGHNNCADRASFDHLAEHPWDSIEWPHPDANRESDDSSPDSSTADNDHHGRTTDDNSA